MHTYRKRVSNRERQSVRAWCTVCVNVNQWVCVCLLRACMLSVSLSLSAICMYVAVYVTMQRRGKKPNRAEMDGWMDWEDKKREKKYEENKEEGEEEDEEETDGEKR
jgi:hypothetical protein